MNYIYYFSGTGNSLQIANDLCEVICTKQDDECKINKIAEYSGDEINGGTLGIIFPVYNWGMPLIICNFLSKVNVSKSTYIYAVANFGGLPGKALDQCKDMLEKRSRKLSCGFIINMPGNYILAYGAKTKKTQEKLFAKEKKRVQEIAGIVKSRSVRKIEKSHTIIDRLCTNYFYKDVAFFHDADRNYIVDSRCVGCRLCAKRCPVHNITIENGKPVWNHKCELCLACIQSCPNGAINYGNKTEKRKRYLNPNVKW